MRITKRSVVGWEMILALDDGPDVLFKLIDGKWLQQTPRGTTRVITNPRSISFLSRMYLEELASSKTERPYRSV